VQVCGIEYGIAMIAEVIVGVYFLHYIGFVGRVLERKYKTVLLKYD
jgi:hypothetical protein